MYTRSYSPPREEGWLRSKKMSRSHRSGADGVVAYAESLRNAFWKISPRSTTPSAPSKVASQHFLEVASTPPHEEGNSARVYFSALQPLHSDAAPGYCALGETKGRGCALLVRPAHHNRRRSR